MKLIAGTRGSDLALAQTRKVLAVLQSLNASMEFEAKVVTTSGDLRSRSTREALDDKKEWILELEEQLLAGEIDLAVHSAKDVPIDIEQGTTVCPVLERGPFADVLVLKGKQQGFDLSVLGEGAAVGTSSLRRASQLLNARPDLSVAPLRGNVPTRIEKLSRIPELDAIVLAEAGIARLEIDVSFKRLSPQEFLPAVNQGILLVQYCEGDQRVSDLVAELVHEPTYYAWEAERAFNCYPLRRL